MGRHTAKAALISTTLALFAGMAQAKTTPIKISSVRAPNPPHCMSDQQWTDATVDSPLNLFDGDPERVWVLCPRASEEPDYAVDVRFAKPVKLDQLRVQLATEQAPLGEHSLPQRLEIAFLRSDLSSIPIAFRTLELAPGRDAIDLSLKGALKWSPNLINDPEFGARRQAKGYDEYDIPLPLEIDGMVLVIRRQTRKAEPIQIAELQMWFEEKRLPVKGLAKAHKAHEAFLSQGLKTVVTGYYFVSPQRILGFASDGRLWEIPPASWAAGVGFPKAGAQPAVPTPAEGADPLPLPKQLGQWKIKGSRLEVTHRRKSAPIRYVVDDAPNAVIFEGPLVGGKYEVQVSPPRKTASGKSRPTLGEDPLADPPLLDDPDGEEMIPIP